MERYRKVLYEWNDSLNRNLALVESYFGDTIRRPLEETVYEDFSHIGERLEACYAARKDVPGSVVSLVAVGDDLDKLSNAIYVLNVKMIDLIQTGSVGAWREGTGRLLPVGVPGADRSRRR